MSLEALFGLDAQGTLVLDLFEEVEGLPVGTDVAAEQSDRFRELARSTGVLLRKGFQQMGLPGM
jgi:hypothetical protein